MDKQEVLGRFFGYSAFRQGQEELIDGVLSGRDVFGIMPTGGGKSICYQVPAMLLPGVTLVVSPLISLMRDQVLALKGVGIPAAYINSTLSGPQMQAVYRNLLAGQYKIVVVITLTKQDTKCSKRRHLLDSKTYIMASKEA